MTVILQMAGLALAQGVAESAYAINVTNSGDENIEKVRIKIIDIAVFDYFENYYSSYWNCLNTFGNSLNFSGYTLPAGSTKSAQFRFKIKDAAPIQDHPLVCYWQYIVY